MYYYYRGVQSWSWYYPHHYAPYISDIRDFKSLKLKFDMSSPFLPFQQLLSVLPAASGTLVPEAYRNLMTDVDSKILHYYPTEFSTDLNGKKQEWEAVVLIPFIDEKLLITEMDKCSNNLTQNEIERNIHGPMLSYKYTDVNQGSCDGPANFSNIANVFCTETKIHRENVTSSTKIDAVIERHNSKLYYPGFPTMKHLNYSVSIQVCEKYMKVK